MALGTASGRRWCLSSTQQKPLPSARAALATPDIASETSTPPTAQYQLEADRVGREARTNPWRETHASSQAGVNKM